ncbi:MAG: GNAT family N-acetyltransferase [Pseudomonadales bacterium]
MLIQSERLIIRNTVLEDSAALYREVFSDSEVVQHTFGRAIHSLSAAEEFIQQHCNFSGPFGLATLVERNSGEIVGLAGVIESHYLNTLDYEFGFILGQRFQGRGYATEIGRAQINYIEQSLNATRVIALASPDNRASIHTIEKLGLTYMTTLCAGARGDRAVYSAALNAHH